MATTEEKMIKKYKLDSFDPLENFFPEEDREDPQGVYTAEEIERFYSAHYVEDENPTLEKAIAFLKKLGSVINSIY